MYRIDTTKSKTEQSSSASLRYCDLTRVTRSETDTYSACGTEVFSTNTACSVFSAAIHIIFYLSICSWEAENDVSWPCLQHYSATGYEYFSRAKGTSQLSAGRIMLPLRKLPCKGCWDPTKTNFFVSHHILLQPKIRILLQCPVMTICEKWSQMRKAAVAGWYPCKESDQRRN